MTRRAMRDRQQIDELHWNLWGMMSRELSRGCLGYPKQVPYYTPPRTQASADFANPDTEDWDMAERIATAANQLKHSNSTRIRALEEFYGAYPGASGSKADRMQRIRTLLPNRSRTYVYDFLKSARLWVEGAVEVLG